MSRRHPPISSSGVMVASAAILALANVSACLPATTADVAPDVPDGGVEPLPLDATDLMVLDITARAFEAFSPDAARIWSDDYHFDRMPIVLLRRDEGIGSHALLVNHPASADALALDLPENLANLGNVQRVTELSPFPASDVPFDFSYSGSGTEALLVAYRDAPGDFADDLRDPVWMLFYVHESFHQFQIDAQWPEVPGATQDLSNYPFGAENAALAMAENRALMAALQASSAAMREEAVAHFSALRAERLDRFGLVHELDEVQEKFEGTARYIEARFLGARSGDPRGHILEELERDSTPSSVQDHAGDVFGFGRFYGTGAAIGWLLDDAGVSWKPRMVEATTVPSDLLRATVSEQVGATTIDDAKSVYGYDALLSAADMFDFRVDDAYALGRWSL